MCKEVEEHVGQGSFKETVRDKFNTTISSYDSSFIKSDLKFIAGVAVGFAFVGLGLVGAITALELRTERLAEAKQTQDSILVELETQNKLLKEQSGLSVTEDGTVLYVKDTQETLLRVFSQNPDLLEVYNSLTDEQKIQFIYEVASDPELSGANK